MALLIRCTVICLVLFAILPVAAASEISMEITQCETLNEERIVALLDLELRLVEQSEKIKQPLRVSLLCEKNDVRIDIFEPLSGKSFSRQLNGVQQESSKERIIGLAVSQMYTAAWLNHLPESKAPSPEAAFYIFMNAGPRMDFEKPLRIGEQVELNLGGLLPSERFGFHGLAMFRYAADSLNEGEVDIFVWSAGLGAKWRSVVRRRFSLDISLDITLDYALLRSEAGLEDVTARNTSGFSGSFAFGVLPSLHFGYAVLGLKIAGGYSIENPVGTSFAGGTVSPGGFYLSPAIVIGLEL